METKKTEKRGDGLKTAAWIAAAVFLLSLIPVLYVSRYAHPLTDDYNFGFAVHRAVENGEGLLGVLRAAWATALDNYRNWQGTFAALFVFALQPGAFGDGWYFLTTFLMTGALTASVFTLFRTVLKTAHGCRRAAWIALASAACFLMVQRAPDKHQAFYWFNGSSYYTLFFALMLLLVAALVRIAAGKGGAALTVFSVLAAFLLGGGNYSTGLLTLELLVLLTAALFFAKHPAKVKTLVAACACAGAFLISTLCPGNAARTLENAANSLPPVTAVLRSFAEGARFVWTHTGFWEVLYLMFLFPVLLGVTRGTGRRFPLPAGAAALGFCLFCSLLTPPLYAMGYIGEGRQLDIYYDALILLWSFVLWYVCGWLNTRHAARTEALCARVRAFPKTKLVCAGAVFTLLCAGHIAANTAELGRLTGVNTAVSLVRGTAADYDRRYREMLETMASEETDVAVAELEPHPVFFGKLYLTDDPREWANEQLAAWFGKNSVVLKH
ncbi:MAG: DUF6056 family protein [Clostridia bacterium]|nr:DUF6056 family protein [Clostridia bacterium]